MRSPSSPFADTTVSPIFLVIVPLIKPLTLWACQPAAFMISASVAPVGLFNRSMIFAALLPSLAAPASLAALGVFLVTLAFLADLPLAGATCAPRAPARAFFVAFRSSAVAAGSGFWGRCHDAFSFRGDYRGEDIDHSDAPELQVNCDRNLREAKDRRCGGAGRRNCAGV